MNLPLDPSHPDAPHFWKDEEGGELAGAVERFLTAPYDLSARDLALLVAYVGIWVNSPAWDANPHHDEFSRRSLQVIRDRVIRIRTIADFRRWLAAATDVGLDPL